MARRGDGEPAWHRRHGARDRHGAGRRRAARREVLVADAGSLRAWWHYAEDVDTSLPDPDLDVTVEQVADGYRLTVMAGALVRDLAVLADRLAGDAVVDDMLATLLPGESATFTIRTAAVLTKEQLTDPLVLRSANQLTS